MGGRCTPWGWPRQVVVSAPPVLIVLDFLYGDLCSCSRS
jgi:hypothetical protein